MRLPNQAKPARRQSVRSMRGIAASWDYYGDESLDPEDALELLQECQLAGYSEDECWNYLIELIPDAYY